MKFGFSFSTLIFILISSLAFSQVPKRAIVEHITNTRCSVCGNTNPKFYNYYKTQTVFTHIAYHPSSPYSTCVLNMHNVQENDNRVKYYNVFGSTPRFLINGSPLPTSSNYSNASTYQPFLGDSTPIDVIVSPINYVVGKDSFFVEVKVKTLAINSLGKLRLFVALTEDTIFYNAPNGEDQHYDVFRKAFTAAEGVEVNAPLFGDSLVLNLAVKRNQEWALARINAFAILQEESNKALVQSFKQTSLMVDGNIGINQQNDIESSNFYPNPVIDELYFGAHNDSKNIQIFNLQGQLIFEIKGTSNSINLADLQSGIYFLKELNSGKITKFFKL